MCEGPGDGFNVQLITIARRSLKSWVGSCSGPGAGSFTGMLLMQICGTGSMRDPTTAGAFPRAEGTTHDDRLAHGPAHAAPRT